MIRAPIGTQMLRISMRVASSCNAYVFVLHPFQFVLRKFHRKMTHKVFVYGTLKRNEPNHYWLTSPENGKGLFISAAETKVKYPLIIATKYNIPFLLHSPGNGNIVQGEIYEVDDLMLSKLDILEGHPEYYQREMDDITNKSSNQTVKCWVYFLKNFKLELLQRPQYANYSSSGDHGLRYLESKGDESTIEDLNDLLQK